MQIVDFFSRTVQKACFVVGLVLVSSFPALSASPNTVLGPTDPGCERGTNWICGANGDAYLRIDEDDPQTGNKDFLFGNKVAGNQNRADWRSEVFSLGPAEDGAEAMTLSFSYKLPDRVSETDNIMVFLRFYDKTGTNFLGQHLIMLGAQTGDSQMKAYKTFTLPNLRAVKNAQNVTIPESVRAVKADIWLTCNIFSPWTSGDVRFDNFSVTTIPASPWYVHYWMVLASAPLILGAAAFLIIRQKRKGV